MSIEEKIEQKILKWKDGDCKLSCRDRTVIEGNKATYYLWTSPVVVIHKKTDGKYRVEFSFCGWHTQTTKERISYLLRVFADCYIFQKDWKLYLNDSNNNVYPIDSGKSYTVEDGKLLDVLGREVKAIENFKR